MKTTCALLVLACVSLTACEEKSKPAASTPNTPGATPATATLPGTLFLAAEPAQTKPVNEAKTDAKVGDPISLRGRIGGSRDPFVAGRAVFTIVSPSLPACSDNPDDHCKTPWDYCCETKQDIATHSATIQVVDASGAPLKLDLKGRNGLKELSELIVVGNVSQKDGSVLVVNATGLFIAKQ